MVGSVGIFPHGHSDLQLDSRGPFRGLSLQLITAPTPAPWSSTWLALPGSLPAHTLQAGEFETLLKNSVNQPQTSGQEGWWKEQVEEWIHE